MMGRYDSVTEATYPSTVAGAERITGFLRAVYSWMCVGLALTALVAFLVAGSDWARTIATHRGLLFGLFAVQLGVVITLSAGASRLAPSTATLLFLGYSALTGVTLSYILLVYTGESIATTFFVTAGMFGALALYGTSTRRSLAGWSQFLFMGLIGVVLASLVGLFWHNGALQFLISFAGVIVFTGLTAYDAQRLKAMALAVPEGRAGSYAIVGALSLYLNFVNLFLSLLRFSGGRRD
jgi:FtsH-binding integral membrane protein